MKLPLDHKGIIDDLQRNLADGRHRAVFIANGKLVFLLAVGKRFEIMMRDHSDTCVGVYDAYATRTQILEDYFEVMK